jgi:hypothetical protein
MSFIYKTINHLIYVQALDIENTEYLHGSFKYKDSARRWAQANSNPNVRPFARTTELDISTFAPVPYTPKELDNINSKTGAAEQPQYPEPTAEQLEQFYLIHGEGAEYKINPDNGWPIAV